MPKVLILPGTKPVGVSKSRYRTINKSMQVLPQRSAYKAM